MTDAELKEAFLAGVRSIEIWLAGTSHQPWLNARRAAGEAEKDFNEWIQKRQFWYEGEPMEDWRRIQEVGGKYDPEEPYSTFKRRTDE